MKRLQAFRDNLMNEAMLHPSSENIRRYKIVQDWMVNQASMFASRWEKVLLDNPELDYSLKHPFYNGTANIQYTEQLNPAQQRSLAKKLVESDRVVGIVGNTSFTECGTNWAYYKAKGFQVSTGNLGRTPQGVELLVLANRASGPLANPKVRQAIQYAIPRDQITKALYVSDATPTSSLVAEGDEGYSPADTGMYPYDVTKAKQLLAGAGYPNGVTISVLDASFFDPGNQLGQALAAGLKSAGITLTLATNSSPPGDVVTAINSKKYDGFIWSLVGGTYTNAYFQFAEKGGLLNPFGIAPDPTLMGLINTASVAPTDQQASLMQKATERLDTLSWAAAVSVVPTLQVIGSNVSGVPATFSTYELDPFDPNSGGGFAPAK